LVKYSGPYHTSPYLRQETQNKTAHAYALALSQIRNEFHSIMSNIITNLTQKINIIELFNLF